MARKTVARRHSKVLPMSTDLDDLMRRDDALYDHDGASDRALSSAAPAKVNRLSDRLEALISPSEPDGPEIDGVVADDSSPQDTDERAPLRSSSDGRPSASGSAAGRGADSPHSSQGESASKSSSSDKREKAAPKREAAQGAQAAETTKRDLYIADLKQEGERRAAQGMDALQEFLDGMEPDDQAYINPLVQGWYKTARAVDNGSAA
jgi:recombination protein RecT